MKKNKNSPGAALANIVNKGTSIRVRSEKLFKGTQSEDSLIDANAIKLIHELEAHQLELKMQNEELQAAVDKAAMITALYDCSPTGYFTIDRDGTIFQLNLGGAKLLGAESSYLVNSNIKLFISDETLPLFNDFLMNAFESNSKETCEVRLAINFVPTTFVHIEGFVPSNGQKCLVSAIDITKRKQAEEQLQEQKRFFEQVFSQSSVSTQILDKDGWCERINQKLSELFGVRPEDIQGRVYNIFKDEGIRTGGVLPYLNKVFHEGLTAEWDVLFDIGLASESQGIKVTDKKKSWFHNWAYPILNDEGQLHHVIIQHTDITENKRAEEKLKTLGRAIEQGPSSIVITNADGKIEFVNKKFTELTQYQIEDVRGKSPRIFNPGHFSEKEFAALWDTLQKENIWKGEVMNRRKDQSYFWEEATISTVKNDDGTISNYILIMDDITEKKQLVDSLIAAKEKAEESDRLKSTFLANMSHEIRTPLNSIIGFSDLLLDPYFGTGQHSHFASIIKENGNNLLMIISDIMDLSKIEAGQVQIKKQLVSVSQLIFDIQQEYSFPAIEKGIELQLNSSNQKDEILIHSDSDKLRQILVNFVGNAIKFTEKGFIEIGIKKMSDFVQFHVKDTGIGIPAEFHSTIFERFRQVETANTRKYGGNGLGLAISKALVELLGGTIWMESEQGKGSTFYFTIPN